MMKIYNFRGDLTDFSAKKEALSISIKLCASTRIHIAVVEAIPQIELNSLFLTPWMCHLMVISFQYVNGTWSILASCKVL